MLLIKRTSAWDELTNLVDRDEGMETSSPFFKLYDAILESEKFDALDNVVSDEFPNGVEVDELEDFFRDEQDFILDELGIDRDNIGDFAGSQEDDDEDDYSDED